MFDFFCKGKHVWFVWFKFEVRCSNVHYVVSKAEKGVASLFRKVVSFGSNSGRASLSYLKGETSFISFLWFKVTAWPFSMFLMVQSRCLTIFYLSYGSKSLLDHFLSFLWFKVTAWPFSFICFILLDSRKVSFTLLNQVLLLCAPRLAHSSDNLRFLFHIV